ncbi:hypothetical protein AURDEDRAFT_175251 [Auricularia subglabra TFB-10046 SS5]|nr:hypothetical protein AURDEDRAFT_175251 [Auricularia subglabra TFB-10046 SS5]
MLNEALVALLVEGSAHVLVSPFPRMVVSSFERALDVSIGSVPNIAHAPALNVSIDPPVDVSTAPVREVGPVPHVPQPDDPLVQLLNEPLVPLPVAPFALVLVQPSACVWFVRAQEVWNDALVTAPGVSLEPALDRSCPPLVDTAHVSVVRLPDHPSARVLAGSFARRPDVSVTREGPLDEPFACGRPVSFPRLLDLSFVLLPEGSFVRVRDDSFARAPATLLAPVLEISLARKPPLDEPLAPLLDKSLVFVPDPAPIPLLDESHARGLPQPFASLARVLGDACGPLLDRCLGLGFDLLLILLLDQSLARGLRERFDPMPHVPFAPLRDESLLHVELPVVASFDIEDAQLARPALPPVVAIVSAFARSSHAVLEAATVSADIDGPLPAPLTTENLYIPRVSVLFDSAVVKYAH